jgi:hypothetical protein
MYDDVCIITHMEIMKQASIEAQFIGKTQGQYWDGSYLLL